jgi:hypothetical protein
VEKKWGSVGRGYGFIKRGGELSRKEREGRGTSMKEGIEGESRTIIVDMVR